MVAGVLWFGMAVGCIFYPAYNVGADLSQIVLNEFCNHKKLMSYVKIMIALHMKLGQYARNSVKDKTFLKLLAQLNGKTTLNDLYYLTESDMYGRLRDGFEDVKRIQEFLIEKTNKLGCEAPTPFINGQDLIALGINQGPKMKELLELAYDMQLGGYTRKAVLNTLGKEKK